ncbi:MAG: universal stress protein [Thaumarchaeota archaeon]|nr:universal stress protein [Nitrososphaerota archaeon]
MGNIKKILVPLDGSKNSLKGLENAINLARQCGATITGISVLSHLPVSGLHNVSSLRKRWLQDAKHFLSKAKDHVLKSDVNFDEKIVYGHAGNEIADFARKNRFDLIVIGSRGRSPVKETFLGGTASYVVHKSQIPVLVCK